MLGHPETYSKGNKIYKNKAVKDALWSEKAKDMGTDGESTE